MSPPAFRFANGDDVVAVTALIERAYRGPAAARGWTNESALLNGPRTSAAEIAELINRLDARFVLAEQDGALIACALVTHEMDHAHFGMFAVDPDRQAAGVGKALLAACELAVRSLWGVDAMAMSVISLRTELIDWYVRRGYALTGLRGPFPFEAHSGAVRTDFDLVELEKRLAP